MSEGGASVQPGGAHKPSASAQIATVTDKQLAHSDQTKQEERQAKRPYDPRVRVIVTGDTFYERYIWRDLDTAEASPLPYTWPDELREARLTETKLELSGVPLHADIFDVFLKAWGFHKGTTETASGDYTLIATPGSDTSHTEADNPYSVFLHELGPFPRAWRDTSRSQDYVWRIKQSFGGVHRVGCSSPFRHPTPSEPQEQAEIEKMDRSIDARQLKFITDAANELRAAADTLESQRTILIINDRNVTDRRYRYGGSTTSSMHFSLRNMLRRHKSKFKDALDAGRQHFNNLIVIWHVRQPILGHNPIADIILSTPGLKNVVIPIVSYHCLREVGIPIRFDMSYESTIRTLLESHKNPAMRKLLSFPHVLIRFDYGVMHMTSKNNRLVGLDIHAFDSGLQRFDARQQGVMLGTTPLLVAAMLREILEHAAEKPNESFTEFFTDASDPAHPTVLANSRIDRAIDAGLLLSGLHVHFGFGNYESGGDGLRIQYLKGTLPVYDHLAKRFCEIAKYPPPSGTTKTTDHRLYISSSEHARDRLIRLSAGKEMLGSSNHSTTLRKSFSRIELLSNNCIAEQSAALDAGSPGLSPGESFDWFLTSIVKRGFEKVVSRKEHDSEGRQAEPSILCPYVTFGDYISVDAKDIDSFLALRNVVDNYANQETFNKPLALAVFGPPGSGKSFVVKQVLKSVRKCRFDDDLVFNLSQTKSSAELGRYFHKIQDAVSEGVIPVAFFDEFDGECDGQEVGWLKHFLMPIQDGQYTEGDGKYDVSKAIFVFAGGVTETFAAFVKRFRKCKNQKAPDFISRLRGFMDVQSISLAEKVLEDAKNNRNENEVSNDGDCGAAVGIPDSDEAAQLRRAVILRSMLLSKVPQIVDKGSKFARIEDEIVDAFLQVPGFEFGVRSMEAIIQMSRLPENTTSFLRSALPPAAQIELHVNKRRFFEKIHEYRELRSDDDDDGKEQK